MYVFELNNHVIGKVVFCFKCICSSELSVSSKQLMWYGEIRQMLQPNEVCELITTIDCTVFVHLVINHQAKLPHHMILLVEDCTSVLQTFQMLSKVNCCDEHITFIHPNQWSFPLCSNSVSILYTNLLTQ